MIRKIIIGLVLPGLLAFGVFQVFGEQIIRAKMLEIATDSMKGETLEQFDDGLHVMLCGAGSPLPDPIRSGPCVLVVAGKRVFVVDAGSGAAANIAPSGIPLSKVERVFLTHFHSDHIDGLGELSMLNWASSARTEPLPVHGPEGVRKVVMGFNLAYGHDFGYRVAHHGQDIIPREGAGSRALPFATPEDGEAVLVFNDGGIKVTAFRVPHPPIEPAVGYRFEYKGRSLVISGDTAKSANLQKFADGTDLLVHEALAPHLVAVMKQAALDAGQKRIAVIFDDILEYHTTPVEVAEIARAAKVGHLLYYHIVPALPIKPMEKIFLKGVAEVWDGPLTVGRDGTWVGLPANSKAILTGNLLPF